MSSRTESIVVVIMFYLWAAVSAHAQSEDVCKGYSQKQQILNLGGDAAFAPAISSKHELKARFEKFQSEIELSMKERGLERLIAPLLSAVQNGKGITERSLAKGEELEWMVYRKRSGVTTFGPMCVATDRSFPAFEISIDEESGQKLEPAVCALAVSGGCLRETIEVDTSGSVGVASVEMTGPDGGENPPAKIGTYEFTATVTREGNQSKTTHTFVIPKDCVNLAYAGSRLLRKTSSDSCIVKQSINVKDCQKPCEDCQKPCEDCQKPCEDCQKPCEDCRKPCKECQKPCKECRKPCKDCQKPCEDCRKPCKECQKPCEDCQKPCKECQKPCEDCLEKSWMARFFGLRWSSDVSLAEQGSRLDGLEERSALILKNGLGIGASLESRFGPRLGLETSLLYIQLDSRFFFDLGSDWAEDSNDLDMLALLVGPNVHLLPNNKVVDLYAGPFIGIADLGSASYRVLGEIQKREVDSDILWGAQLGLDIPIRSESSYLHAGARYIEVPLEIGDGASATASAWVVEAGIAFRF